MWQLIRLTFRRWRGQEQRVINSRSQAEGRLNISAQICSDDLVIHDTLGSDPSSIGRQGDIDNSVCKSERDCAFVEDERRMRGIANREYRPFLGARIGIVCHAGSCRFWKWDDTKACFVPLA